MSVSGLDIYSFCWRNSNSLLVVENLNLEELSQALAAEEVYEFPLVLNPPRIKGATGAAVNSFAILPR